MRLHQMRLCQMNLIQKGMPVGVGEKHIVS